MNNNYLSDPVGRAHQTFPFVEWLSFSETRGTTIVPLWPCSMHCLVRHRISNFIWDNECSNSTLNYSPLDVDNPRGVERLPLAFDSSQACISPESSCQQA